MAGLEGVINDVRESMQGGQMAAAMRNARAVALAQENENPGAVQKPPVPPGKGSLSLRLSTQQLAGPQGEEEEEEEEKGMHQKPLPPDTQQRQQQTRQSQGLRPEMDDVALAADAERRQEEEATEKRKKKRHEHEEEEEFDVSTSLLASIHVAQHLSKTLRQLSENMKSQAEMERIEEDKKIADELALQEELRAQQDMLAQQESKHHHAAAIKCQSFCRAILTRLQVTAEKRKRKITNWMTFMDRRHKKSVGLQASYRGRRTRRQVLEELKIEWDSRCEQAEHYRELIQKQVHRSVREQRAYERGLLLREARRRRTRIREMFVSQITYWTGRYDKLAQQRYENDARFAAIHAEVQDLEIQLSRIPKSDSRYAELDQTVQRTLKTQRGLAEIVDMKKSERRWARQHLRQLYRRKAFAFWASKQNSKLLDWIYIEMIKLELLAAKIDESIAYYGKKEELFASCVRWLRQQRDLVTEQMNNLDVAQENMLVDDIERLDGEEKRSLQFESLMTELERAYTVDEKYTAERVSIERELIGLDEVSDDAVRLLAALRLLLSKQEQIRNNVVDALREAMGEASEEEDVIFARDVVFMGDDVELDVPDMPNITVEPLEPLHLKHHASWMQWYELFMLQPWTVEDSTIELKDDEKLNQDHLELDKMRARVQEEEDAMEECDQKTAQLAEMVKELRKQNEELSESKEQEDVMQLAANEAAIKQREGEADGVVQVRARHAQVHQRLEKEANAFEEVLNERREELQNRMKEREKSCLAFMALELERGVDWQEAIFKLSNDLITRRSEVEDVLRELQQEATTEDIVEHLGESAAIGSVELFKKFHDLQHEERKALHLPGVAHVELQKKVAVEYVKDAIKLLKKQEAAVSAENPYFSKIAERESFFEGNIHDLIARQKQLRGFRQLQRDLLAKIAQCRDGYDDRKSAREEQKAREEEERRLREEKRRKDAEAALAAFEGGIGRAMHKMRNRVNKARVQLAKMRALKDRHMDEEETKMATFIRRRQRKTEGKIEAISKIRFTVGEMETEEFAAAQQQAAANGFPHYVRVEKGIGVTETVYIWYQLTANEQQFITDIKLSHTDPDHELYVDLLGKGYEKIMHDKLFDDEDARKPNMMVWVQRDMRSAGFAEIEVSYSLDDERRLESLTYTKLASNPLTVFNLADALLWTKLVRRSEVQAATNTDAVLRELEDVRRMLKKRPDDGNLVRMEQRLLKQLAKVHLEEERTRENELHPLRYAVQLLALNETEVNEWLKYFEILDKEKEGTIEVDDVFEYIEMPKNDVAEEIFTRFDCKDEDGRVEFGDFVKAIGIFCFFGKDEIVSFLFSMYDKKSVGYIMREQYLRLLSVLHPYDKSRAKRSLQEIEFPPDGRISLQLMKQYNLQYPSLLHPVFDTQNSLRKAFFGIDWWFEKMSKYNVVKAKLKRLAELGDVLARREAQRKYKEEERKRRQKARIHVAHSTNNRLMQALMYAMNVADEFS